MKHIVKKIIVTAFGLFFLASSTSYAQPINDLFHNASDPVIGNPQGQITIVEFFDYQCSHCITMAPIISNIIKTNPNLRVVLKEFPIRGPVSEFAARAALAANKQGKYADFSHALLSANQPLTETDVLQIAKASGLNLTQLKKDMDSPAIYNQLDRTSKLAQTLKLIGTPAFFIAKTNVKNSANVNDIPGAMSQSELQEAINAAQ